MASLLVRMLAGIFRRSQHTTGPGSGGRRKQYVDQGQLNGIKLNACRIGDRCQGVCCSKGATMPKTEAARISQFIEAHPEYFLHLKVVTQAIVPLDMLGRPGLCQTEVITPTGIGSRGLYRVALSGGTVTPADNAGSKCVFALPDHRCSLQVASVALGFHKWEYKPTVCWLFPLKSVMVEEKDDCRYFRLEYAGSWESRHADYPCSRLDAGGRPAHEILKEEMDYYRREFIGGQDGASPPGERRYSNLY